MPAMRSDNYLPQPSAFLRNNASIRTACRMPAYFDQTITLLEPAFAKLDQDRVRN
jgi:hypothetical protein